MGGGKRRNDGVDAFEVGFGDERLVVLSYPIASASFLDRLTPAERDVALAVVRGLSNEEVARARGSRARTVAVQLASIYRKLGITSRAELAVLLHEDGAPRA